MTNIHTSCKGQWDVDRIGGCKLLFHVFAMTVFTVENHNTAILHFNWQAFCNFVISIN